MMFNFFVIELRNRFILLITNWFSLVFVCYIYRNELIFGILNYKDVSFFDYFIFVDITEMFTTYLTLIYFISSQIFYTYGFFNLLMFICPGLYIDEYKRIKIISIFAIVCWFGFSYVIVFHVMPIFWEFFLHNSSDTIVSNKIHFEARISSYLNFVITSCFNGFLYYITFLTFFGILNFINNHNLLAKSRKIIYLAVLIINTLLTPPDCFALVLCYTITIFILESVILFSFFFRFLNV